MIQAAFGIYAKRKTSTQPRLSNYKLYLPLLRPTKMTLTHASLSRTLRHFANNLWAVVSPLFVSSSRRNNRKTGCLVNI